VSLLLCATANHFLPLLSTSYADQPACQANSVFSVHKMWISINRKFFSRRYDRMCFQNFRIPICSATLSNNYYTSTVRAGLVFLSFVGTAFRGRPPMERVLNLLFLPRAFHDRVRTFRGGRPSRPAKNPTRIGPVLPCRSLRVCPPPCSSPISFQSFLCYRLGVPARTQREGALPWNGQHLSTKKSI
jgi:hypothetical protein